MTEPKNLPPLPDWPGPNADGSVTLTEEAAIQFVIAFMGLINYIMTQLAACKIKTNG